MELVVVGPAIDPEFEAAVRAGVAAVGIGDLSVVYTNDFVNEVRMLTGEDHYTHERGSGTVAARTIRTAVGEVAVIANRTALENQDPAATERVMAHESGHVLISRRGEDVDWPETAERLDDSWERTMAWLSAIAVEEYRCEATVYSRGYPVEFGRTDDGINDALLEGNADILQALTSEDSMADPGILRDKVMAVMDRITKVIACLAARHLHNGGFDPGDLNPVAKRNWNALIRPTWERHLAFYSTIPPADRSWGREPALDATCGPGATLNTDLLRDLGFHSQGPEGGSFLVDVSEAEFKKRIDRFVEERELRGWSNDSG